MDDLDRMLTGGAKSAKFEQPGDTITGVVDEVMIRQATEYGTGKPLTFDDGNPREQIVVIIRAEGIIPEDENDDLFRAVYIKGWGHQRRAFVQAVRDGGKPAQGSRFTATYTRQEPSKSGGFPAKVFEYRIQQLAPSQAETFAPLPEVTEAHAQALKLWDMNMTVEQISAVTGLSADEVESLTSDKPF